MALSPPAHDILFPHSGTLRRQARSPDYVSDFPAATGGLAPTRAFMLIKDAPLPRSTVRLVEEIVGEID